MLSSPKALYTTPKVICRKVLLEQLVFPTIPMCPLEADQQAKASPANTSKTPRITLATISLYHSLLLLSIESRKQTAQQSIPGRCAAA